MLLHAMLTTVREMASSSTQAAVTDCHRRWGGWGRLNNTVISCSCGGWKSEVEVLTDSGSHEHPPLAMSSHGGRCEGALWGLRHKDANGIHEGS